MTVTVLPAPHAGLFKGLFHFIETGDSNAVAKLRNLNAVYSMRDNIRICKKKQKHLNIFIDNTAMRVIYCAMKTTERVYCSHEGCNETGFYSYDSKKDAKEHYKSRLRWKCIRHASIEKNMSLESMEKEITITNQKVMYDATRVLGMYWDGKCGLSTGPCHIAHAKDFPEGTKLVITAKIILP